jgi:hypothetical protein
VRGLLILVVACCVSLACGCGGSSTQATAPTTPTSPAGSSSCTQGASSGNWQQVGLSAAMLAGGKTVQGIYAAKDCYVYVSTAANGTWRAKVTDIRANPAGPTWSRIDAGFPGDPVHGGTACIISWAEDGSGNLFGGIGEAGSGAQCTWCVVGKWNGTTWSFSNNPAGMRQSIPSMSFDATGNLYINDLHAEFYKSTDGGATFGAALVTDAYTHFGLTSGYAETSKVIGNKIYWGGEGPYMQSPLDFSTASVLYGATGFGGNVIGFASDGTASTAPTYIVAASRCDAKGYCMQRYSAASGTWTDLQAAAGIPQYMGFTGCGKTPG